MAKRYILIGLTFCMAGGLAASDSTQKTPSSFTAGKALGALGFAGAAAYYVYSHPVVQWDTVGLGMLGTAAVSYLGYKLLNRQKEVEKPLIAEKPCREPVLPAFQQKITSALFSSAIGDALGRVTEFIKSPEAQFERYPGGLTSFDKFHPDDWQGIPREFRQKRIAPYTDDTAMALLVAQVLIESQHNNWDRDSTMGHMAESFVKDLDNADYGWAAGYRAPGNACLAAAHVLQGKAAAEKARARWWDVKASSAGGCGSVMRAFPFGLVFSKDPQKAKLWAVEHSKITHGAPSALAACAAMALGTAEALRGEKDPRSIVNLMIEAAKEYDAVTAQKMSKALSYASQAQDILGRTSVREAFLTKEFFDFHKKVFNEFQGWSGQDAIAATVYVFALFPKDIESALYVSVHTPGDSDSIAAMSGALIGAYSGIMPDNKMVQSIEGASYMREIAQRISDNR